MQTSPVPEETIIISDPASRLNIFKRIVAIGFGSIIYGALIATTVTGHFEVLLENVEEVLFLAGLGLGLIIYGLLRTRIIQTLYLKFSKSHIEGRYALRMDPEEGKPNLFQIWLIKPNLAEINIELREIKEIGIKPLDITIQMNSGEKETIPLTGMSYQLVQKIKSRFRRVLKSVHASRAS